MALICFSLKVRNSQHLCSFYSWAFISLLRNICSHSFSILKSNCSLTNELISLYIMTLCVLFANIYVYSVGGLFILPYSFSGYVHTLRYEGRWKFKSIIRTSFSLTNIHMNPIIMWIHTQSWDNCTVSATSATFPYPLTSKSWGFLKFNSSIHLHHFSYSSLETMPFLCSKHYFKFYNYLDECISYFQS